MSTQQLQGSGVSTLLPICIAYTEAGHICGRPASVLDKQRGGMVCHVHAPKPQYEVTRSYLAKAEELLLQAAEHTRKESAESQLNSVKITSLAMAVRRLRFELEGGGR
jgi:hypothetical protein